MLGEYWKHNCYQYIQTIGLKDQLFRQYCYSFYGAPLWYLKSDGGEAIYVAWRKALRTIYKVHPATQCDIITALSGQVPLLSNIKARFGKKNKSAESTKIRLLKLQQLQLL